MSGDTTGMYPPKVIEYSRRLYEGGEGRSIGQIRDSLRKLGYEPKRDTIRYWVDDEYREEKLHRQRKYKPPGPARRKGWQFRRDRMRELRETVELSHAAIARLMAHDFGLSLSRGQVEDILAERVKPKTARRLLYPQEES